MLSPHVAGGAVVVGDQIIVSGGQADGKLNPTTEVFDGTAWKRVADLPTPREHLGMATDGTFAYVVGGRDLSSDKNSAALERYDPKTDSWAALAPLPAPRGGIGAAVADGRLVVAGGEEPTSVDNSVYAYDIASNTLVGPAPAAHRSARARRRRGRQDDLRDRRRRRSPATRRRPGWARRCRCPPRRLQPAPVWRALKDAPDRAPVRGHHGGGRQDVGRGRAHAGRGHAGRLRLRPGDRHAGRAAPTCRCQLHHLAAVTYHDEVVVIGGWAPANGNLSGLVSGKVFALRNGAWVELPPLTHPRVARGRPPSSATRSSWWAGRPTTSSWRPPRCSTAPAGPTRRRSPRRASTCPRPRTARTCTRSAGGTCRRTRTRAAFERFDPATGAWQTMPNMPTPRGGVAAAFVDGRIVAAGGEEPTRVLPTVEAYDIATGTWSTLPLAAGAAARHRARDRRATRSTRSAAPSAPPTPSPPRRSRRWTSRSRRVVLSETASRDFPDGESRLSRRRVADFRRRRVGQLAAASRGRDVTRGCEPASVAVAVRSGAAGGAGGAPSGSWRR